MAVVASTWADVVPNGIFLYQEIARISWEIPDSYPYAVLHMRAVPAGDWGITNDAFEPVIEFHYIAHETEAQGADPLAALNIIPAKLETLKNGLRAASFADSQATLLDFPQLDFSGLNVVNLILIGKNVPTGGGVLAARFTLGESAT